MAPPLFPAAQAELAWARFEADGYRSPVSGVVYTSERPPCCGVPIGGLGTGCVDVDTRGIWGWSTLFNPVGPHYHWPHIRVRRKLPAVHPMLGLATGGRTWVLATRETLEGGELDWCSEPHNRPREGKPVIQHRLSCPQIAGVEAARAIRLWGHYPVADLVYETDAPIQVSLRAWAPFLPGDALASNIPGAVFEVHLVNTTDTARDATIALSFPGPDAEEARAAEVSRAVIRGDLTGTTVASSGGVDYFLGVTGFPEARLGADMLSRAGAWARVAEGLPVPRGLVDGAIGRSNDRGATVAVDVKLAAGEERVVRFILTWYAPRWEGTTKDFAGERAVGDGKLRLHWQGAEAQGEAHVYTHMYASRYTSSLDVARRLAAEHPSLLRRVLAWQAAVYDDESLPVWLRDSLVNNLALMAETSYWTQPRVPLGDWAFPGGLFSMDESPRGCPHMCCIPCDWYGNFPVVFLFPELARTTLRAFREYQTAEGEIPFALGRIDLPDPAVPEYHWQVSLNGFCYIDLVDRLWRTTRDPTVLVEFYDSVRRCADHLVKLSSKPAPAIRMPDVGGMEWFEFGDWAGMATHAGALRLSGLRMAERMAQGVGDTESAGRFRAWYDEGAGALETHLWADGYYLNYLEPETGKRSDVVMAYQLDGEWASRYHGLGGVFRQDRVQETLRTIERCNIALTPDLGAANFALRDGSALPKDAAVAFYGQHSMFPPEVLVLAYTFIASGHREKGLELARKHWSNLCLTQRHPWDLPNIVDGRSGERWFGTDYYQNMMLWAMPSVLDGTGLDGAATPVSLVGRVLKAARAG